MASRRTGRTGLTTGIEDAQRRRDTREQARIATGAKGPTRAGRFYRKSYLLTMDVIDGVKDAAEANQVGISEFVRWALVYVLDGLKSGEIEIPIREEVIKRRIEV